MSDESTSPADLSNLGIDLSQMFRPAWTVEASNPSDTTARLAAKFDEGDRPSRFDRGDRGDRRGGSGRGERPRGAGGGRGPGGNRDSRGAGPDRGGQGGSSRGGRPEGRGGDKRGGRDRRDSRDHRDQRSEPAPKPVLEGWTLGLIPETAAIEGIAKQIRSRGKAYPLFELARLIVRLSDRYSVRLTAESESSPELFRVKTDGSLWTSRKEAATHLLSRHMEKFYRKSSVTVEPPKGSYTVVAECGMSGTLLGPPNHHEYTSRLIALHAARFKNLPFEVYKSRIRMSKDEAMMERWKAEQSTRTIYIPITGAAADAVMEEAAVSMAPEEPVPDAAPVGESSIPVEQIEGGETPAETTEIHADSPAGEASPAQEAALEDQSGDEAAEAPTPSDETAVPAQTESGLTLEEATTHFYEHHAAAEIEPAGREIVTGGHAALHGSTPLIRELLLRQLQELDRFPLPLAHGVGRELASRGLQIFKAQKKIVHVSVARPKYLDRETTPIGEGFRVILDYLEAHPKQQRDKQWAALLALRADPAPEVPVITEPSVEGAIPPDATPDKDDSPAPADESLKRREQALGADLLWLLHQGHVIDFAMGNLQAALKPTPKPDPKPAQNNKEAGQSAAESTGVTPDEHQPAGETTPGTVEEVGPEETPDSPAPTTSGE